MLLKKERDKKGSTFQMAKRITDELLVSRSEHHDGSLSSLEELSLHQQHLSRLEYVNRACSKLKILLLQDNCIARIENTGRLRSLEYLNLAMNNVERIENLECCESLQRLDLTLNFIGMLTDVEKLRANAQLSELTLMGNPCCAYDGYRDFVVGTLPGLALLDGAEVSQAERIVAKQVAPSLRSRIVAQQGEYLRRREEERGRVTGEIEENRKEYEDPSLEEADNRRKFYKSMSKHTPEYRLEMVRKEAEYAELDEKARDPFREEDEARRRERDRPRRLFDEKTGRPLNVNQANIGFRYDDGHWRDLVVELDTYKHLDPSLIDLDVEPTHLRATIRGKVFQLAFFEEVRSDQARAERSGATGKISITVPKVNQDPEPVAPLQTEHLQPERSKNEYLEVTERRNRPDVTRIVEDADLPPPLEEIDDGD